MIELPKPIPLPTVVPASHNKNEIAEFILKYQKVGNLKKCSNLDIHETRIGTRGLNFRLKCNENSLYSFKGDTGFDFHGCPTHWHFYEPKLKDEIKRFLSHYSWKWRNFVDTWWTRYSQLSPWVQLAILILILMTISPYIVGQLVEHLAKLK